MGGELGVQSEPGGGSLFSFTASFKRSDRADNGATMGFDDMAGLIVTTDVVLAQIIASYMDSWGLPAHKAGTRADMLAALESTHASTWIAVVDSEDLDAPNLREVIDAVHAMSPARVVVVGGGSLRKPIRQSYLFDAIARAADLGDVPRTASPQPRMETHPAPTTNARVLVAEDNTRLQRLLKLQFDELGVPVTFVSDGQEAVEALRNASYAMVFMDCQMPNMGGLEATRVIRIAEHETGAHIPIAAMTANAFAEDRNACLEAGMDDYLAKPVRLQNLRDMIERWAPTRSV
jgi:CheY-like chemotaxis protein